MNWQDKDVYSGISEELLAAFDEGKTNAKETMMVLKALSENEVLQEEYFLSKQLDAMMEMETDDDVEVLPIMAMAAESEGNLCNFQCETYILQRRGITANSDQLTTEATKNYWLRDKGTPLHSIGRILEHCGLIVMRRYGAEIADIKRAINAKHDVVVVLNNNKLRGDEISNNIAYHAVVVDSIIDNEICIYNPAVEDKLEHYDIATFEKAWKDAKSYMVRVKGRDFDYNPQPIDLDDVELTLDLLDLREAIAENAHEVWADQRQEEGWTYGPERNDQKKQHPDMVPYSMLPESEKEYDRRMAFDTIKLMKKLGYDIVKHSDSKVYKNLMHRLQNIDNVGKCKCGADIFRDQIYCSTCGEKLDWKDFFNLNDRNE